MLSPTPPPRPPERPRSSAAGRTPRGRLLLATNQRPRSAERGTKAPSQVSDAKGPPPSNSSANGSARVSSRGRSYQVSLVPPSSAIGPRAHAAVAADVVDEAPRRSGDFSKSGERFSTRGSTASACTTTTTSAAGWRSAVGESHIAGATTVAGRECGSEKTNQDSSFLLHRATGGEDFICGVIDGHGTSGHVVSAFVRKHLGPQILAERRAGNVAGTRKAMTRGFVNVASKLKQATEIDAKESGAVVAVCLRKGQDIYVANAGDARAVVAAEDGRGKPRGLPLTRDHTPALLDECERVRASGGEVAPTFVPRLGFAGPPRVWRKAQLEGGLAVTRAIGDTALGNVGVTPEPEVTKRRVGPNDKMVVVASDGCWEYLSNDRVAELALKHSEPRKAAEAIAREARKEWQRDGRRTGYIDDITCLVAKLA